jgi:hypothetical protein
MCSIDGTSVGYYREEGVREYQEPEHRIGKDVLAESLCARPTYSDPRELFDTVVLANSSCVWMSHVSCGHFLAAHIQCTKALRYLMREE